MADSLVNCKFPCESLVPKNETGVLNFLKKYPTFNGEDVVIAIFDSGVDPKAAGLQCTPDRDVKVLERFDCTGCGDVDTSKVVQLDVATGTIVGLSGRKLKVSEFMKANNTTPNEYRVGLKSFADMYPAKIRDNLIAEYKMNSWDEPQKRALANVQRELDTFDAKNNTSSNGANNTLTEKEKLKKEDFENSLEFLNFCEKKFSEIKIAYDCVLFPTANGWTAVIDLSQVGDLEKGLVVVEYTKSKAISSIDDHLSVSINVHDNGDVLEIVGMCSSHGTHVASIASCYNKDNPLECGVAPAAKIMSFTIGDGRLGSMETGVGLVRAIIKVMELCKAGIQIDVINMSYGEHAHWSNNGRIGELMNEVINKYGVIWVVSAGNHGPALCTIGTPPDISQASMIGVGAYVSPDMMEAEYAFRQKLPANVYTWSSRDPCIDGGQGVTICAPGGAIASVPEFTLHRAEFMNGTSMAAPHVSGALALIISGLKKKGIKYTPFSVKRALWNTATKLGYIDQFAQGNGLLNVEKAFEYLVINAKQPENNIRFSVSVGSQNAKGIHIRDRLLKKTMEYSIVIRPEFFNEKEVDPREKINFNMRLTLVPSESWVQCGAFLDMCYQSRTIVVMVDPTALPAGVHSATIRAYDTSCVEKGIIFEIPITVVQPEVQVNDLSNIFYSGTPINCKPNTIIRKFLLVPNNAMYAVLRMISTDSDNHTGGRFFVHTMQILSQKYCKALETQKILPVTNDIETVHAFRCEGNNILEICIAKFWSNFGDISIKFSVEFHGTFTNGGTIMHGANGIHRLDLNTCTAQEVSPAVVLKNAVMVLKPNETKISSLTERDVIPPARQIYQNLFTYNLHISKPAEIALHAPLFSTVLYESEFESQFWMIFDNNKMMVGCGDAYSNCNFIKVEKGDYVIKLQVRHEKKDLLEKIVETLMLVSFKLPNPLSLDIYPSFNSAAVQGKKLSPVKMCARSSMPIFITPIPNEKISKASIPYQCSWLEGSITYSKDDFTRKCDGSSFTYVLIEGPAAKKSSSSSANGTKETKSKFDEYKEGLRDYQIGMIPKLDREHAEELYDAVVAAHPEHLQTHYAFIQHLDTSEIKTHLPFAFRKTLALQTGDKKEKIVALRENLQKIFDLSGKIINETDKDSLLAFYGLKMDNRPDASKIKTTMDKQKTLFLDACVKRAIAVSKMHMLDGHLSKECSIEGVLEELDRVYEEVGKFIDYTDLKVTQISIWHAFMNSQYGRMTKYLIKNYEDKLQREFLDEMIDIGGEKQWSHVVDALNKAVVSYNPTAFRLF